MLDFVLILSGEIISWSLMGGKGLNLATTLHSQEKKRDDSPQELSQHTLTPNLLWLVKIKRVDC